MSYLSRLDWLPCASVRFEFSFPSCFRFVFNFMFDAVDGRLELITSFPLEDSYILIKAHGRTNGDLTSLETAALDS